MLQNHRSLLPDQHRLIIGAIALLPFTSVLALPQESTEATSSTPSTLGANVYTIAGSVPLPSFMGHLPITAILDATPSMGLNDLHWGRIMIDPVTTTLETFFNILPLYANLRFEEVEPFPYAGYGPIDFSGQQVVYFEEIGLDFLGAHYPLFSSEACSMILDYRLRSVTAEAVDQFPRDGEFTMTTEWKQAENCHGVEPFLEYLFTHGVETGEITITHSSRS